MESVRQQGQNQLQPLVPHYDKILCITGRVIAVFLWFWTISAFLSVYISTGCFLYLLSCIVTFLEFSKLLEKRIVDGQENVFRKSVNFFLKVDTKQRSIFYFTTFIIIALLFEWVYGRVFVSFIMLVMAFLNFGKWFFLREGPGENDPETSQRETSIYEAESSNENVATSEVGGDQERSKQFKKKSKKNDSDSDEEDAVELYSV